MPPKRKRSSGNGGGSGTTSNGGSGKKSGDSAKRTRPGSADKKKKGRSSSTGSPQSSSLLQNFINELTVFANRKKGKFSKLDKNVVLPSLADVTHRLVSKLQKCIDAVDKQAEIQSQRELLYIAIVLAAITDSAATILISADRQTLDKFVSTMSSSVSEDRTVSQLESLQLPDDTFASGKHDAPIPFTSKSSVNNPERLGRAIINTTCAAVDSICAIALVIMKNNEDANQTKVNDALRPSKDESLVCAQAFWSSLSALEKLVSLSIVGNTNVRYAGGTSFQNDFLKHICWSGKFWESALISVEAMFQDNEKHDLRKILDMMTSKESSSTKQLSMSGSNPFCDDYQRDEVKMSSLGQGIGTIRPSQAGLYIPSNTSVPIRRWGSMAFVWLCRGQLRVLKTCIQVLSSNHFLEIFRQRPTEIGLNSSNVPANVARLIYCARIIDLVSDSSNCIRSPWQTKENFVRRSLALNNKSNMTSPRRRGGATTRQQHNSVVNETLLNSSIALTRPSILSISLRVTRLVLSSHALCLKENLTYEKNCNPMLNVGGFEDYPTKVTDTIESLSHIYPWIHCTINNFSRAVGSSFKASTFERSSRTFQFASFAAALYLEQITSGEGFLDARLVSYLSVKLAELIPKLKNTTVDEHQSFGRNDLDLDCPIELAGEEDLSDNAFENVFRSGSPTLSVSSEILALYLRVMNENPVNYLNNQSSPERKKIHVAKVESEKLDQTGLLTRRLLSILESCYVSFTHSNSRDDQESLLKTAYNITAFLGHILTAQGEDCSNPILSWFRESIDEGMIKKTIVVGKLLNEVVIDSRVLSIQKLTSKQESDADFDFRSNYQGFTPMERRVWTSHIKLCLTIARGQPSFIASKLLGDVSILKPELRLELCKSIAQVHSTDSNPPMWPLRLPSMQHSLISGNFSSEPIPTNIDDLSPERYVLDGLIRSVEYLYQTSKKEHENKDGCLLSKDLLINDARLFVLCLSRLPIDEQQHVISKLLLTIGTIKKFVYQDKVSTSTGKLFIVLGAMIKVSGKNPYGFRNLADSIGPTLYHLPVVPSICVRSSWCNRESCFMSLFSDLEINCDSVKLTEKELTTFLVNVRQLKATYCAGIDLGFRSAPQDNCYLLFAAWNMSAQLCLSDPEYQWDGWSFPNQEQSVSTLMALRDDMCSFHNIIVLESRSKITKASNIPSTGKMLKDGLEYAKTCLKTSLEALEYQNSSEVEELAREFALFESLILFVNFLGAHHTFDSEGAFDSFGENYNESKTRHSKKVRGISEDTFESGTGDGASSEDSERGFSDEEDEDDEDACIDAFSRYHDICCELGVAPTHPDWLDKNCQFREGVTCEEAASFAKDAMTVLVHFGKLAFENFESALQRAINIASPTNNSKQAAQIIRLHAAQISSSAGKIDETSLDHLSVDFNSFFGSICKVDQKLISRIFDITTVFNDDYTAAKEACTQNTITANRIRGKIQEIGSDIEGWEITHAEMRASGEWELLLAECLLGAALQHSTASTQEYSDRFRKELDLAGHWNRLLIQIVDALVGITSLLNLTVNKGREIMYDKLKRDENASKSQVLFSNSIETTKALSEISCSCLSFVTSIGSRPYGLNQTCQMVMFNLTNSFTTIVNLEKLARMKLLLESLEILSDIVVPENEIKNKVLQCTLSGIYNFADGVILETSSCRSISSNGTTSRYDFMFESEPYAILLAFLSLPRKVPSLTFTNKDPMSAIFLAANPSNLIKFLCGKIIDKNVLDEVRCHIFRLVIRALERFKECGTNVTNQLVVEFWKNVKSFRAQLLSDVLYFTRTEGRKPCLYEAELCRLWTSFLHLLVKNLKSEDEDCKLLLKALLERLGDWSCIDCQSREHVFYILIFLAQNSSSIKDVVDKMLSLLSNDTGNLEYFLAFELLMSRICQLNKEPVIENKSDASTQVCFRNSKHKGALGLGLGVLGIRGTLAANRTCSFVETSGEFTEQHWYNCYTCGLLRDKGCCSLCALVCHKGHDLRYSRRSSFFCDCGAESDSSVDVSRPACKCLNPLSQKETDFLNEVNSGDKTIESNISYSPLGSQLIPDVCLKNASELTLTLKTEADRNESLSKLCSIFKACFRKVQASHGPDSFFDMVGFSDFYSYNNIPHIPLESIDIRSSRVYEKKLRFGVKQLVSSECIRNGKELKIKALNSDFLKPLRALKSSSLKLDDSFRLGSISKYASQNSMVVDSRGRGVVAESNWLLFYNLIPVANMRNSELQSTSPTERNQMCALGKSRVKFEIVGMALCEANNRLLLVWGVSEACIVILSKQCDSIDVTIELVLDLEPHECETEYLLKCEWLTPSHVVCVCGTFVKTFDLRGAASVLGSKKEFSVKSTACYSLAYEDVLVRAAVLIQLSVSTKRSDEINILLQAQLVILLDNGRLLSTCISVDSNGDFEVQGDIYIECGDGFRFPIAGIRRYSGTQPSGLGSTSNSLGEGSSLFYCKQSDLLLYKCTGSPVIAMKIVGDLISGSFELLSNTFQLGGSESDKITIQQPFTHWTELGTYKKEQTITYRLACVARVDVDNRAIILLIDYSDKFVEVKSLDWPLTGPQSFEIGVSRSFESLNVFSTPFIVNTRNDGFFCESAYVKDRLIVSVVQSNGSMLFYGENMLMEESDRTCLKNNELSRSERSSLLNRDQLPSKESKEVGQQPSFPPQIFEYMDKSEHFNIKGDVFSAELDPSIVKEKLSIDNNSEFISCPARGCYMSIFLSNVLDSQKEITLTESIEGAHQGNARLGSSHLWSDHKFVSPICVNPFIDSTKKSISSAIVAIRFLLGKNGTDFPRSICLMGRYIKTIPCQERWYDIPLTDEEVMMVIRSGCISIGLGRVHDESNLSIIHAMEVYTKERKSLYFLDPQQYSRDISPQCVSNEWEMGCVHISNDQNLIVDTLFSSVRSLTLMCNFFRQKVNQTDIDYETLLLLVEISSKGNHKIRMRRSDVIRLLDRCDVMSLSREKLVDRGTILGTMHLLNRLKTDIVDGALCTSEHTGTDTTSMLIFSTLLTLHRSLQLILEVISQRPDSYKEIIGEIHNQNLLSECVVDQAEVIIRGLESSLPLSGGHKWDLLEAVSTLNSDYQSIPIEITNIVIVRCSIIEIAVRELCLRNKVSNTDGSLNLYTNFHILGKLIKFGDMKSVSTLCSLIAPEIVHRHDFTVNDEIVSDIETSCERGPFPPMAYRCDGCHIFPITVMRYTLEEFDIDLCRICYFSGKEFALARSQVSNAPVQINGRTLLMSNGASVQVHHIDQMSAVAVEKLSEQDFEQVKQNILSGTSNNSLIPLRNNDATPKTGDSENAELHPPCGMANDENTLIKKSDRAALAFNIHLTNVDSLDFIQAVFDMLLQELITTIFFQGSEGDKALDFPACGTKGANNLIAMLVYIVRHGDERKRKEWGEKFATDLSQAIFRLIHKKRPSELPESFLVSLVLGLNALKSLISLDKTASTGNVTKTSPKCGKTHPSYTCNHGVPAVRRKCSEGTHKNRRFYVCGMNRNERCQYFKWTDKGHDQVNHLLSSDHHSYPGSLQLIIQALFCNGNNNNELSLQSQLCQILQWCQRAQENQSSPGSIEARNIDDEQLNQISSILGDIQDISSINQDFCDGAFLSKTKLGLSFEFGLHKKFDSEATIGSQSLDQSVYSILIQSALDLLSRVVSNPLETKSMATTQSSWDKGWLNLLCSIISMTSASSYQQRTQAKRMLKRLCGGQKVLYHSVRDYHIFSIQYNSLLSHCKKRLDEAFTVKEKARMCGAKWKDEHLTWDKMKPGDLLGLEGLISEDSFPLEVDEIVNKILSDLIESTKTRNTNWKHFCITSENPIAYNPGVCEIDCKPFTGLVWMASCLPGRCQVKVLQLIDVALSEAEEKLAKDVNADEINADGNTEGDYKLPVLTENDIIAFVAQFILNGQSSELRAISSRVAFKLFKGLPASNIMSVIERLVGTPMKSINSLGDSSGEFFALLQYTIHEYGKSETCYLRNIAKIAFSATLYQLKLIGRLNSDTFTVESSDDSGTSKEYLFDLSRCIFCSRRSHFKLDNLRYLVSCESRPFAKSRISSNISLVNPDLQQIFRVIRRTLPEASNEHEKSWVSSQIRPFTRTRLETSTANTVSTEFAMFAQLKHRLVISEFHVNIQDARGRHVKTIAISFTPRHSNDPAQLKNKNYLSLWQRCGTITLGRGISKNSFRLQTPIVASNLKFEYLEFFSNGSSMKGEDGGMLSCPRCTRVVSNAAGVCSHCGEVAFQCRKCRHINYDRLDAFLCVECGYCASGHFSYDVTAGMASNAISIIDDDDYERTGKLLRSASKRLIDSRSELRKKLLNALVSKRKKINDKAEDMNCYLEYPTLVRKSLFGEVPKLNGKSSNHKKRKTLDQQSDSSKVITAHRARSLLNLAQQLRSGSGRMQENRAARGDLLVRQAFLNATGTSSADFFDDDLSGMGEVERDIFSMLGAGSSSLLQSDISGSLSRIVASIQSRNRAEASLLGETENAKNTGIQESDGNPDETSRGKDTSSNRKPSISSKDFVKECSVLYENMNESDNECYELDHTLGAWERLNNDSLSDFGIEATPSPVFKPTFCSKCSIPVALNLLSLVISILQISPFVTTREELNEEFMGQLFHRFTRKDSTQNSNINELEKLKQIAILAIANCSEIGTNLVLNELRERLKVPGQEDPKCANILGTLVSNSKSEKFAHLASDILNGI